MRSITLLALLGLASSAAAQEPADSLRFRGVRLGDVLDALQGTTYHVSCKKRGKNDTFAADSVCTPGGIWNGLGTYAKVPVRSALVYAWHGRLAEVWMTFGSDDFGTVTDALVTKYGAPTRQVSDSVQTKAGAWFARTTLAWEAPGVVLMARPFAGSTDIGSVTFSWLPYREANEGAASETMKKRLADM